MLVITLLEHSLTLYYIPYPESHPSHEEGDSTQLLGKGKKIFGCALINKLRSTLLMEGVFHASN
jgi:hypothetical protein